MATAFVMNHDCRVLSLKNCVGMTISTRIVSYFAMGCLNVYQWQCRRYTPDGRLVQASSSAILPYPRNGGSLTRKQHTHTSQNLEEVRLVPERLSPLACGLCMRLGVSMRRCNVTIYILTETMNPLRHIAIPEIGRAHV